LILKQAQTTWKPGITAVLFYTADVIAVLLVVLPFLNPFSLIPSEIFSFTEIYLLTACLAPFLLAWLPLRGWKIALRIMAWGWLLAAILNSIIGLFQYFGSVSMLLIARVPLGDAAGNMRQTNLLATLQVMSLLALVWLWRTGGLPFKKTIIKNGIAVLLATIILAGLAATASRIGMVELAAAVLITIGYAWNSPKRMEESNARLGLPLRRIASVGFIALAFYLIVMVFLPFTLHDAEGLQGRDLIHRWAYAEDSCNSRFTLYRNVLHLISLKPWTGWGWGNLAWANFATLYDGKRMCAPWLDNAHDLPLHLAVTLGIPAAIIICAGILYAIWRNRPWREHHPDRQLAWGVLLMIGLHSLVEYPLWYGPFQIAVVICLVLLWHTRPAARSATAIMPGARNRAIGLSTGLAVLMLAAAGYATWDYWRISQIFIPEAMRAPQWRKDPVTPALKSWLFADQVRFRLVWGTPVTRENAAQMLPMAILATHLGPNPKVIGKIVESAALLGHTDLASAYLQRFQSAMPAEYRQWAAEHALLVNQLHHAPPAAAP
jgi:hypothetical protein